MCISYERELDALIDVLVSSQSSVVEGISEDRHDEHTVFTSRVEATREEMFRDQSAENTLNTSFLSRLL